MAPVENGVAETVVDETIMENLVSDTISLAEETGTRAEVVLKVDVSESVDTVEVAVPSTSLVTLADTENAVLTVETPVGSITFDNSALETITADSGDSYSFVISKVDSSELNSKQVAVVGESPVYDLSILSDGKYISDFDGGFATVKLPYTLQEGENPNCIYVYYVDSDGNINKMQTMYDGQNNTVIFNTSHFSVFTIVHELLSLIFSDVEESDWHFDYVSFAYQNDLFTGTSATKFSPDTAMTRGMLVTTLNSYEGNPTAESEANYSDVPSDKWYASAVDWATENNLVSGMKNNKFAPENSITREELVLILFNYAREKGYDLSGSRSIASFEDAEEVSSWALEAMEWAYGNQLVSGTSKLKSVLSPEGSATRAQVATILKNFIENIVE